MSLQTTHAMRAEPKEKSVMPAVPGDKGTSPILPEIVLAPREWDWVFTCFEDLSNVTGGIGTYHRLLLQELAKTGRSILILTREVNAPDSLGFDATVVHVDRLKPAKPFNFVGDQHDFFSLGCHFALRSLYRQGHRFRFIEFSDYGVDGFYPLRARAAGAYEFGTAAVRLHSPEVMLVEDNGGDHGHLTQFRRDRIDREMSVYSDADVILFGGDAMRDRVVDLTQKFGLDVAGKMRKCPHPYPRHLFEAAKAPVAEDRARAILIEHIRSSNPFHRQEELKSARHVGLFGRIEDRKGQFQMLWSLLHDPAFVDYLADSDLHFVVAGQNVLDHIGNYSLSHLYELIHSRRLQHRFHFTGRVSQEVLAEFSRAMVGFAFPSVFENYPNALLEVLPGCKPVALSVHGCMPEITQGFAAVTHIDPKNASTRDMIAFLDSLPRSPSPPAPQELENRIAILERRQRAMLAYYTAVSPRDRRPPEAPQPSVGFVVPVYQDHRYLARTLASIARAGSDRDQVIVVDDGSAREASARIEAIARAGGARYLRLPVNSGPAAARRAGCSSLDADLIQLCDADDLLEPEGIACARRAFQRDPQLTMLTGVMSCFQGADHCWVPRNGNLWTAVEAHFAHSGSMFRRDAVLKALEMERLPLNEDWQTSLMILAAGGKCRMIPEITYHYRRTDGTRSTQGQSQAGKVHRRILDATMRRLAFDCPEQNARLKLMLAGWGSAPGASPTGAGHFPLRYQLVDSVFFKIVRHQRFAELLLRMKGWIIARRG